MILPTGTSPTPISPPLIFEPQSNKPATKNEAPIKKKYAHFNPEFLEADSRLNILVEHQYCDKNGNELNTHYKEIKHLRFPIITPSKNESLFTTIENFISEPREIEYQAKFETPIKQTFSISLLKLMQSFIDYASQDLIIADGVKQKKFKAPIVKSIELIGKTALYLLGIEPFLNASLKFFKTINERQIRKWFRHISVRRQSQQPGSDADFRFHLEQPLDQVHLDYRLDEILNYITRCQEDLGQFAPSIKKELVQKKEHYRAISDSDTFGLQKACLIESRVIIKREIIFNNANRYGVIGLLASEKPIDLLLVSRLFNESLSSGDSIRIELLPYLSYQKTAETPDTKTRVFFINCAPYSYLKYLIDLLSCTFFVLNPDNNLTDAHFMRFISEATCYGKRLLQEDLEQKMIQRMFKEEKVYLANTRERYANFESSPRFYVFSLIKDYLGKHQKHSHAALLLTFNACQALNKHSQLHLLTDKDYSFIWDELDKQAFFKCESEGYPFLMQLKKALLGDKLPFSEIASFLQLLTFIFQPKTITRHNGNEPAFNVEFASPEGLLNLLFPYQPLENVQILKKLEQSPHLNTFIQVYSSFLSCAQTKSVYPSPLSKHAEELEVEQHKFVDAALEWMQNQHPFVVYLGFQFYFAIPGLLKPNQERWELLISRLPTLSDPSYLEPVLESLHVLAQQYQAEPYLKIIQQLKASTTEHFLQTWIANLVQTQHPALIYQAFQIHQQMPFDRSRHLHLFQGFLSFDISKAAALLCDLFQKENNLSETEKVIHFNSLCQMKASFTIINSLLKLAHHLIDLEARLNLCLDKDQQQSFSHSLSTLIAMASSEPEKRDPLLLKASLKGYLIPELSICQAWLECLEALFSKEKLFLEYFHIAHAGGYLAPSLLKQRPQALENREDLICSAFQWIKGNEAETVYFGFQLYLTIQCLPVPKTADLKFMMTRLPVLFDTPYLQLILPDLLSFYQHHHCEPFAQVIAHLKKCPLQKVRQQWIKILMQFRNPDLIDCAYQYDKQFLQEKSDKSFSFKIFNNLRCTDASRAAQFLRSLFEHENALTETEKVRYFSVLCQPKYIKSIKKEEITALTTHLLKLEANLKPALEKDQQAFSQALLHAICLDVSSLDQLLFTATLKNYLIPSLEGCVLWLDCLEALLLKKDSFIDFFKAAHTHQFLTLPNHLAKEEAEIQKRLQHMKICLLEMPESSVDSLKIQVLHELIKSPIDPDYLARFTKILENFIGNYLGQSDFSEQILEPLKVFVALTELKSIESLSLMERWLKKIVDPSYEKHLSSGLIQFTDALLMREPSILQPSAQSAYDWSFYPLAYLKASHCFLTLNRLELAWKLFSCLDTTDHFISADPKLICLLIDCLELSIKNQFPIPPFISWIKKAALHPSLDDFILKGSSLLIEGQYFKEAIEMIQLSSMQGSVVRSHCLKLLEVLAKSKQHESIEKLLFHDSILQLFQQNLSALTSYANEEAIYLLAANQLEALERAFNWIKKYLRNSDLMWATFWKALASFDASESHPLKEKAWKFFYEAHPHSKTELSSVLADCWVAIFKNLEQLAHPALLDYFNYPESLDYIFPIAKVKNLALTARTSILKGIIKRLNANNPDLHLLAMIISRKDFIVSCFRENISSDFGVNILLDCLKQLSSSLNLSCQITLLEWFELEFETCKEEALQIQLAAYLINFLKAFNSLSYSTAKNIDDEINEQHPLKQEIEKKIHFLIKKIPFTPSFYSIWMEILAQLSCYPTQSHIDFAFDLAIALFNQKNEALQKHKDKLNPIFSIALELANKNQSIMTSSAITECLLRGFDCLEWTPQQKTVAAKKFLDHHFLVTTDKQLSENLENQKQHFKMMIDQTVFVFDQLVPFVFNSPSDLQPLVYKMASYLLPYATKTPFLSLEEFKKQVHTLLLVPFRIPQTKENLESLMHYFMWLIKSWHEQRAEDIILIQTLNESIEILIKTQQCKSLVLSLLDRFIYLWPPYKRQNVTVDQLCQALVTLAKKGNYFKDCPDVFFKYEIYLELLKKPISFTTSEEPFIKIWNRLIQFEHPQAHLKAIRILRLVINSFWSVEDKEKRNLFLNCLESFCKTASLDFLPSSEENKHTLFSRLQEALLPQASALEWSSTKCKRLREVLTFLYKYLLNKIAPLKTEFQRVDLYIHYLDQIIRLLRGRYATKEFHHNYSLYLQELKSLFPFFIEAIKNLQKKNPTISIDDIINHQKVPNTIAELTDLIHTMPNGSITDQQRKEQRQLLLNWLEQLVNLKLDENTDSYKETYLIEALNRSIERKEKVFHHSVPECEKIFTCILGEINKKKVPVMAFSIQTLELNFKREALAAGDYFAKVEELIKKIREEYPSLLLENEGTSRTVIKLIIDKPSTTKADLEQQINLCSLILMDFFHLASKQSLPKEEGASLTNYVNQSLENSDFNSTQDFKMHMITFLGLKLIPEFFNYKSSQAVKTFNTIKDWLLDENNIQIETLVKVLELHFEMDFDKLTEEKYKNCCMLLKSFIPCLQSAVRDLNSFTPSYCFVGILLSLTRAVAKAAFVDKERLTAQLFISWMQSFNDCLYLKLLNKEWTEHLHTIFEQACKHQIIFIPNSVQKHLIDIHYAEAATILAKWLKNN